MGYIIQGGNGKGSTFLNPVISLSGLVFCIDPLNAKTFLNTNNTIVLNNIVGLYDSNKRYSITSNTNTSFLSSINNNKVKFLDINFSRELLNTTSNPPLILSSIVPTFSSFCVQVWVRRKKNGVANIVRLENTTDETKVGLEFSSSGKISFAINYFGISNTQLNTLTGEWNLITINVKNNKIEVYRNLTLYEEEISLVPTTYKTITVGPGEFDIGQILIYDRPLLFKEIKNNYDNFNSRFFIEQGKLEQTGSAGLQP